MNNQVHIIDIIQKLATYHDISNEELKLLCTANSDYVNAPLATYADNVRRQVYGIYKRADRIHQLLQK